MWSVYNKKIQATAGISKKSGSLVFDNKGAVRLRFDPEELLPFLDYLIATGCDIQDLEPVTDEWVLENLI